MSSLRVVALSSTSPSSSPTSSRSLLLGANKEDSKRRVFARCRRVSLKRESSESSTSAATTRTTPNHRDDDNDAIALASQRLLLEQVAAELEWMKRCNSSSSSNSTTSSTNHGLHRFPPACYRLVKSLPGNNVCFDCRSSRDTDWATTSYGALLCLQCSGRHRSLGVEYSKVRSLTLDHWSHEQVLSMLEGGNQQLHQFLNRHHLTMSTRHMMLLRSTSSSSSTTTSTAAANKTEPLQQVRYRTKAARFYREQLALHAKRIASSLSAYPGRDALRKSKASAT